MGTKNFGWITHKGKRIFCTDYSGLDEDEYCLTADEARRVITREPENSVLCVAIVRSGKVTDKIRKKAKEQRDATRRYVKALAAVGLKGPPKILAQLIYRDIHFAESLEDALDWLAAQDEADDGGR